MPAGRVISRGCGKFRTGAGFGDAAMSAFSLTPTGWSDNESVWGRIWRGEVGFDFDDGQFILEIRPDRYETHTILKRNRRIITEVEMAPRKNIRREGESSTATLTPPPPQTAAAAVPSKFIEARPVADTSSAAPTRQQIRERAYQIYLARNGGPGDPTADWLQAERELIQESRQIAQRRVLS